jgi:sulfur carrier protein
LDTVLIAVNGEPLSIASGSTLPDLLASFGRDPRTVAVEKNGAIVRRDAFAAEELRAGDRLEIVHFVQGG